MINWLVANVPNVTQKVKDERIKFLVLYVFIIQHLVTDSSALGTVSSFVNIQLQWLRKVS